MTHQEQAEQVSGPVSKGRMTTNRAMTQQDKLLTPAEVSRRLQVRTETVWRWIKKGVVPFEEVGPYRKKRIRESVVATLSVPRGSF